MANLETLIAQKNQTNTQWKEQRQAEREGIMEMQDAAIIEVTSSPEMYARYLELQGSNPTYSPGNTSLVMFCMPEASVFGTADRWKMQNRSVKDTEVDKGAKIFARSPNGKGYVLADAYDFSQTYGRPLKEMQLQNGAKDMETALNTLLNYAVVPLVSEHMDVPAMYNEVKMELSIDPDSPDDKAFAAIATEVAHSRMHAKGTNHAYDRTECALDAQSVSYILCRRFGISCQLPDMSNVGELYAGWDAQDRRKALDSIQDLSKQIGNSIERNITPQPRNRVPSTRPSR